jgi:hypothetical protein
MPVSTGRGRQSHNLGAQGQTSRYEAARPRTRSNARPNGRSRRPAPKRWDGRSLAVVLIACVVVVCLVLLGVSRCSQGGDADNGSGSTQTEEKVYPLPDGYAGVWQLTQIDYASGSEDASGDGSSEGTDASAQDSVSFMASMNLYCYLVLCDDGTACLDYYGTLTQGTWKADADGNVSVEFDDDQVGSGDLALGDEGLVLDLKESDMVFAAADASLTLPSTAEEWTSPNEGTLDTYGIKPDDTEG